jgi:hypothetical protein
MPVPTGFSENAVDFLVCYRGYFLAIETKIHPRKPTALQQHFMDEVHEAEGFVCLAYDLGAIERVLSLIDAEADKVV